MSALSYWISRIFLGFFVCFFNLYVYFFSASLPLPPPPPAPVSPPPPIIHFVFWSIFPTLLSIPVPFTSVPAQGWEKNVLSLCSRQIFLLGNGLRSREKLLYFLLCFSFWPLITEFAIGNGRDRRFCFGQMLVTKMNEWRPELWSLPWNELPLWCYVNLLNFELFHYL